MSGHSKWHNIQKTKGAQDAKRAQAFTKIAREMIVAVKEGGSGDPNNNSRLAAVIAKAKAANMPNDNIKRTIDKALGSGNTDNYESITYEGYGPSGVAIIVETMTDNRNRTAAEVRHAFSKCGGNLGTDGSVAYMFERKGQISFAPGVSEDALMEAALEAGADDVEMGEDGSALVSTTFTDFHAVNEALSAAGFKADEAEIAMIPSVSAPITELDVAQKVLKLIDMLEDLDDVQNVYHNAEISDELMEQLD